MVAVAAARLGTVTEASVSVDCTEPATTNGPAVFFSKMHYSADSFRTPFFFLWSQYKHLLSQSAVSTITCSRGFTYAAPSIWKKIPLKISKLATACPLPLLRGKTRHIIFPAPSLRPALPSSPLATAHDSDSAL